TMRAALGATRGRLIRQLLTESLLLAALGCAAGIILGVGGSRSFSSISFHTALPIVLDFRFDWRVFVYALAAAALTTLLVGPVPALRTARGVVNKVLHEGVRTFSVSGHRLRSALVSAQVGGSLMLLIVAGLFTRSLENIQHSDLGFDPTRSEEHTSELQSRFDLVCRLLLEKKKYHNYKNCLELSRFHYSHYEPHLE